MSKHVSPLLGYNNNVRHKNRVFHIQTEDSGVKHPHIITHLFMDGGRILKSDQASYAEHVGTDKMQDTVKQMMKEQHKAMFIALRDGQFDAMLEDGHAAKGAAAAPVAIAEGKAPPQPVAVAVAAAASAPVAKHRSEPPPPESEDDLDMVPQTTRMPEMTLDIGALERAATSTGGARQLNDLPPPPANMFRDKNVAVGAYRTSTPATETTAKRLTATPPKKVPSAPPKKPPSTPRSREAGIRGALRRRASGGDFRTGRPQQGSSIFGEDLISDKSLDEVILSYLAEDLEPAPEKKK